MLFGKLVAPVEEIGGLNLYNYVSNNLIARNNASGLGPELIWIYPYAPEATAFTATEISMFGNPGAGPLTRPSSSPLGSPGRVRILLLVHLQKQELTEMHFCTIYQQTRLLFRWQMGHQELCSNQQTESIIGMHNERAKRR